MQAVTCLAHYKFFSTGNGALRLPSKLPFLPNKDEKDPLDDFFAITALGI